MDCGIVYLYKLCKTMSVIDMNRFRLVLKACVLMASCGVAGCSLFRNNEIGIGPTVEMSVGCNLKEGTTLEDAVYEAAAKHHWTTRPISPGNIRCVIHQRAHIVEVMVVLHDDRSFSIVGERSNIPVRKYNQWISFLSREIVFRATDVHIENQAQGHD